MATVPESREFALDLDRAWRQARRLSAHLRFVTEAVNQATLETQPPSANELDDWLLRLTAVNQWAADLAQLLSRDDIPF